MPENQSSDKLLIVEINSPEKEIWSGHAYSISSVNSKGPFDILPLHSNFITIIENQAIKINTGAKIEEFNFKNAVLYVTNNKAIIYTL